MAKAGKTKKPSKKPATKAASGPSMRLRKLTRRQSRTKRKKEAKNRTPIPGSFRLTWQVICTLRKFWKPLGGIVLVYLILNIIFASGISSLSSAVSDIKDNLNNTYGNQNHPLSAAVSGFTTLVGSAGASNSSTGSVLQSVLIVLESLVIIWALRQLLAGQAIRVKQAYYQSAAPLVPFLLVIFVIIIQLLPVSLGAGALKLISDSTVSGGGGLTFIFAVIFGLLAAWSVYMVSGSVFALYIVTLPDMQPRKALRSAKNLVRFRRWSIVRRVVFLPPFILVVMGVLIVPLILIFTPLVVPLFYVLSMLAILFVHAYLYALYRSLLA